MKAVKITAPGRVVIEEQTKPVISPDEVLVKICYVGFCGSDLNTFRGKNPMAISPVIPGHEIGGIVEEIGSDVPAGLLEKGMSVTVNTYTACGKCSSCRRGRPNACRHNETMGVQRNGAMIDYIAVPWSKIIPAQGLTPRECALVEPMSVGFHAVDRAAVTDIDTVAVIGCGMIGLGAIVRAALRGATVIAIDLDDEKLALARELGATYSINSATSNLADELSRLTDGHGPDVVIEAVGSPFTYVAAVDNVAFCGRVVCIG
ncbi:MAG: alcohol dehydrogenase catalytic domain-containing protein, partial [Duncaniella sp.]|nr:alcohol dehydrogenase catalytic domain-containing protein [Duncaniella sp.]